MDKSLISIIVTCYNREKYIADCLSSIQRQTYQNFECIIVDDGSVDNSLSIIKQLIKKDRRFILIANKHVGFPEAKNIGLTHRSKNSQYTIFLDSDDMVHPDWLTFLHYSAQITGAPIAVCDFDKFCTTDQLKEFIPSATTLLPLAEYSFLRLCLLYNQRCSHFMWNKLVLSSLYDNIHFRDQPALSDIDVMSDVFMAADRVIQIRLPLVHYRQHATNMSKTSHADNQKYWIWRLGFQKEKISIDWNRCPQAHFILQTVLRQEVKHAQDVLGDDFNKYCTIDDVQYILNAHCVHFIEQ